MGIGKDLLHAISRSRERQQSEWQQRIRCRAYELYEWRGRGPGRALDDWLQAEREMFEAEVRRYAYQLYKYRGYGPGHALDDWLQAEREMVRRFGLSRSLFAASPGLPSVMVRSDVELEPGSYRLLRDGDVIDSGSVDSDALYCLASALELLNCSRNGVRGTPDVLLPSLVRLPNPDRFISRSALALLTMAPAEVIVRRLAWLLGLLPIETDTSSPLSPPPTSEQPTTSVPVSQASTAHPLAPHPGTPPPAIADDSQDAAKDDPAQRLVIVLPQSWFSQLAGREKEHPIFVEYLPRVRALTGDATSVEDIYQGDR